MFRHAMSQKPFSPSNKSKMKEKSHNATRNIKNKQNNKKVLLVKHRSDSLQGNTSTE